MCLPNSFLEKQTPSRRTCRGDSETPGQSPVKPEPLRCPTSPPDLQLASTDGANSDLPARPEAPQNPDNASSQSEIPLERRHGSISHRSGDNDRSPCRK